MGSESNCSMSVGRPERSRRAPPSACRGRAPAAFTSVVKNRHSHHGTCCRMWCGYFRSSSFAISQKMPRRPSGVLQPVSCPLLRRMSAVEPGRPRGRSRSARARQGRRRPSCRRAPSGMRQDAREPLVRAVRLERQLRLRVRRQAASGTRAAAPRGPGGRDLLLRVVHVVADRRPPCASRAGGQASASSARGTKPTWRLFVTSGTERFWRRSRWYASRRDGLVVVGHQAATKPPPCRHRWELFLGALDDPERHADLRGGRARPCLPRERKPVMGRTAPRRPDRLRRHHLAPVRR